MTDVEEESVEIVASVDIDAGVVIENDLPVGIILRRRIDFALLMVDDVVSARVGRRITKEAAPRSGANMQADVANMMIFRFFVQADDFDDDEGSFLPSRICFDMRMLQHEI